MTSLFYKIVGEFGEFRKSAGENARRVRFHIEGAERGIISIGKLSAPVKDGVASICLTALEDGTYTPKLYQNGSLIPLEAIEKCGSSVSVCLSDPALLRGLALRAEELEKRVAELEKRCDGFGEAIEGKPLFGE